MQQIIYFIKKFRYLLLFLFLEIIAFYFTLQHHSYHKSKFVNSANVISGSIYGKMSTITDFVHLKNENKLLIEENTRLLNLMEQNKLSISESFEIDDAQFNQKYRYTFAKIINNNFSGQNNFLTINKGHKDSILPDMGVINSKGIIGVIKNTSSNYATVLSILNSYSKINIRLKNSNHFGTMIWDGRDYNLLQITDIPRQAILKKGDTLITGGKSAIFPEGIPIGIVNDFVFANNKFERIDVQLFNDMSALGNVQIVQNLQKSEQSDLENQINNE